MLTARPVVFLAAIFDSRRAKVVISEKYTETNKPISHIIKTPGID